MADGVVGVGTEVEALLLIAAGPVAVDVLAVSLTVIIELTYEVIFGLKRAGN